MALQTLEEDLLEKHLPVDKTWHREGRDLQEANQIRWQTTVKKCMHLLGKTKYNLRADRKTAHER